MDFLRSALAFLVVLGVLVFIHELGHYLAARWRGIYVEAFSIGFGRTIAGWTDKRGTVWKLGWLPLGGYVKMHGQERPEDVPDDVRARWMPGKTFQEKSVLSRAIVVAAGPIANFLLAAVIFAVLYGFVGRPVATPVIGEVVPDSAAANAGLVVGDRVTAIDGAPIRRFEDIQHIVSRHPGDKLDVTVERASGDIHLPVVVGSQQVDGARIGLLGIRGTSTEFERLSPGSAIVAGVDQTYDVAEQTLVGLWQMITGRRGTEDLGGPLRIAQLSGQAASLGLASVLSLMGFLSVSLGLINLFPIPVLDGGHLMFYAAEALRGSPVPPRAQEYGYRAGFAVLAALFIFATWNDLSHLGLVKWVAAQFGS
jgi:regulator of sigma E protease